MFSKIRAELNAIRRALEILPAVIQDASEGLQTPERLAALEGELGSVMGEARALITEAEARFAAARASEERTRHQVKRLERLEEEFGEGDEDGPDYFEELARLQLQESNGAPGPSEPMQPMPPNVARATGKMAAFNAKWGITP